MKSKIIKSQEEIEIEIHNMLTSEFINDIELGFVSRKCDEFITESGKIFGDNDGEPLDADGIKFVLKLLELKWKLANAVYEENSDD